MQGVPRAEKASRNNENAGEGEELIGTDPANNPCRRLGPPSNSQERMGCLGSHCRPRLISVDLNMLRLHLSLDRGGDVRFFVCGASGDAGMAYGV